MTAFNSRDGGFFLTTVGRVQTPTLAIVVEREEQIRKFVSRDYWEIHASFLRRGRRVPGQVVRPDVEEERRRRRAASADRVWNEREAAGDRRRGARQARHRHRGIEADHAGQPAAVRPDLAAARGQRPLRLLGQDHAVARAEPVRAAQGADLSADRFARAARGLPAGGQGHLRDARRQRHDATSRRFAQQALDDDYVKPSKRIFDNAKVSDHFAIIPTLQAPQRPVRGRAEALRPGRAALHGGVLPERRIPWSRRASRRPSSHSFKTEGKVLVKPGWLAIYGKEAAGRQDDEGPQNLVPVKPGEMVRAEVVEPKGLKTRPPARYSEATLLGAMEGAGKSGRRRRAARSDAGEGPRHAGHARGDHRRPDQREVHAARRPRADPDGQGVPADDAAARPGRGGALQARAHRRVGIQARADGARQARARRVHARDRRDDASTSSRRPRSTTATPCRATTRRSRRRARTAAAWSRRTTAATPASARPARARTPAASRSARRPAGRTFELAEVEQFLRDKHIGPLEGFRSKAGWPFTVGDRAQVQRGRQELEARVRLRRRQERPRPASSSTSPARSRWACARSAAAACSSTAATTSARTRCRRRRSRRRPATSRAARSSCSSRSSASRWPSCWPPARPTCWTSSSRCARAAPFKAFLAWDKEAGKVNFEFEPRVASSRRARRPARRDVGARGRGRTRRRPAPKPRKKAPAAKKAPPPRRPPRPKAPRKHRRRPEAEPRSWPP